MPAAQSTVNRSQALLQRLVEARSRTNELFDLVKPEALYDRPIPERHRIIFYLGHLESFDWNLLREQILGTRSFHPEFDRLFAFGIDPVGGGLPTDQLADWPSVEEVRTYTRRIRQTLDSDIKTALESGAKSSDGFSAAALVNVAIEHRLMHAETFAYMLHQLPLDRKIPRSPKPLLVAHALHPKSGNEMVEIPAGSATLGLARNHDNDESFGWDNEYERCSIDVPAFTIDRYKVTNLQFLEFITAGGYDDPAYWSEVDRAWKSEQNITHPAFWRTINSQWYYLTMFDEVPLPLNWPVYVSHAEASAYARWAGKALPTEAQWHRAAYGTSEDRERAYPWGAAAPASRHGNFDFDRWDPSPVTAFPEGRSAFGVDGLLGNGWEWTSTEFAPFAGFEPFPFYPGYSANFFDGKHNVMKGGSSRTAACMLRRSFRNWFQPHYQYVYSGFRCVSNR